jgi:homoserine O-acetyltransferase
MTDYRIFECGDVLLQNNKVLAQTQLAYQTYGQLNAAADNAVLIPSYYTGTHKSSEAYFGQGRAIDTDRYFVVATNMIGNGLSTSPANAHKTQLAGLFPAVTVYDNVMLQHRLLTEELGVRQLRLVTGWSMGALQAYHFAALYPDMIEALLPFCGSARCSSHNYVFLEGVKAALCADPVYKNGNYTRPPLAGLKAFGRVYCGWAYSQAFFRRHLYREMGFDSIEALLIDWEDDHRSWDANNLLTKLHTWQHADIANHERFKGDFTRAMGAIKARTLVMPCRTDLYFPPEDSEIEVNAMSNAGLRVIDSDWGHCAASPGKSAAVMKQLELAFAELLGG